MNGFFDAAYWRQELSFLSFGDLMRWNPHFSCIVWEGKIE